MREIYRLAAY